MISSEMPELLAHSDRIMVMNQGRIIGVFDQIDQETIMSLIMEDIMKNSTTAAELN
jgi:ABC-type sugar transport system ATPase subunit